MGHYKRDCYKLKGQGEANDNSSNNAVVEKNSYVAKNVLSLTVPDAMLEMNGLLIWVALTHVSR